MNDVRPFEEYKEMIQDMSKEEMIKGLYDLAARLIRQENIIKEVREKLNTQIIETVSAQFNYECATKIIEQAKQILDKIEEE